MCANRVSSAALSNRSLSHLGRGPRRWLGGLALLATTAVPAAAQRTSASQPNSISYEIAFPNALRGARARLEIPLDPEAG